MTVLPAQDVAFDVTAPVLVVGGGACGLTAALAAAGSGVEVVVLERDALPSGSTALSAGLVPAAGTRWQKAKGVEDRPEDLAADIQAKAKGRVDDDVLRRVTETAADTLHWLADVHGVPLGLVDGFRYPGHRALRMHGTPRRTGEELMASLLAAGGRTGIEVVTEARARALFADRDRRVRGVEIERPDGTVERIGCGALVLACNGYGGNPALVARHIPEMADALYFGHAGNTGDALSWGTALGAASRHMAAYQGHGSVAHPHGILITWAVIMEGGVQVNVEGRRFSDETRGYSEQATTVLDQPGGVAWNVYDARIHRIAAQFEDYRQAEASGALHRADTIADLARLAGLPDDRLEETLAAVATLGEAGAADGFGRVFDRRSRLTPPYYAVRVTGALFHTQGGLVIDGDARVLRPDGTALPNLFAGGGAACGVSGPSVDGYLSGNGLLTAVALGRLGGLAAARLAGREA